MNDPRTSDRVAIGELLARYAWALADHDSAAMRACFTADGRADFTSAGGVAGTIAEAAAWSETTLATFDVVLSHTSNVVIEFTGDDSADVRSMFRMVMRIPGDTPTYLEASGGYRDRVVRDTSGWLLADRVEHLRYVR